MLQWVGPVVLWSKVVLCWATVVDDNCYSAMVNGVFLHHVVPYPNKTVWQATEVYWVCWLIGLLHVLCCPLLGCVVVHHLSVVLCFVLCNGCAENDFNSVNIMINIIINCTRIGINSKKIFESLPLPLISLNCHQKTVNTTFITIPLHLTQGLNFTEP